MDQYKKNNQRNSHQKFWCDDRKKKDTINEELTTETIPVQPISRQRADYRRQDHGHDGYNDTIFQGV